MVVHYQPKMVANVILDVSTLQRAEPFPHQHSIITVGLGWVGLGWSADCNKLQICFSRNFEGCSSVEAPWLERS